MPNYTVEFPLCYKLDNLGFKGDYVWQIIDWDQVSLRISLFTYQVGPVKAVLLKDVIKVPKICQTNSIAVSINFLYVL